MDLVDLPEPVLPDDVTIEDATGLEFPDADAVEAMLVDSQTNPEAVESGIITRLADLRGSSRPRSSTRSPSSLASTACRQRSSPARSRTPSC